MTTKAEQAVKVASGHVVDPLTVFPKIEYGFEALSRNLDDIVRLADEEDRLRRELEEVEESIKQAEEGIAAARYSLACSILDATGWTVPKLNHWRRTAEAPFQVRSGNRIFALVADPEADFPTEPKDLPEALVISIVTLDPEALR